MSNALSDVLRELNALKGQLAGPPPPPTTTTTTTAAPNLTLRVDNNPAFNIPISSDLNANFTIEWWGKMSADDNHPRPFSIGSFPNAAHAVSIENGTLYYWIGGVNVRQATLSPGYIGNWTHFCILRSGDTIYFFQNGVQLTTLIWTDAIPTNGLPLYLGSEGNDSIQNGLMSNFRWCSNAFYNKTGFTPPTDPLTNLTGTQLLIFQGTTLADEITDQSGNSNVITNGTGIYYTENPFSGYQGSISFGVNNILLVCGLSWSGINWDGITYRNGDIIPESTNAADWVNATTPRWTYYNFDPAYAEYGRLYNYYAIYDSRNIAPPGWHIATDAEWTAVINCLGDFTTSGTFMKEAGLTHWDDPGSPGWIPATNSSGMTILGSGLAQPNLLLPFSSLKATTWFGSGDNISDPFVYIFDWYNGVVGRFNLSMLYTPSSDAPKMGMSIRLVKD